MAPEYTVRPVRADEWRDVKVLRLQALRDEAAPIAFLESYDDAAARPDEFWQDRARGSALDAGADAGVRQFVAVAHDGTWVGTATVLVERVGDVDFTGAVVPDSGGHVVGVFLDPGHRGRGLLGVLLEAATGWRGSAACPGRGCTSTRTTRGPVAPTRRPASGSRGCGSRPSTAPSSRWR